ncbi:hypothetical protein EVAR_65553_1 [Eumeta japonica]|uniref:Uncharacterized protein n=1 Tax=Eumeta variegata TaxID=151549 RepID=A0A4C1Z9T9_EUMVA|nr:hypothetical protein EVAR_65553_1 [Eumeta japonica]
MLSEISIVKIAPGKTGSGHPAYRAPSRAALIVSLRMPIRMNVEYLKLLSETLCPLALRGRFLDVNMLALPCFLDVRKPLPQRLVYKLIPNLLVGHSFVSLYRESHSTDVLFGRRRRKNSLTEIVSQISVITFELVKPVINSSNGWSFIMIGQWKCAHACNAYIKRGPGRVVGHPSPSRARVALTPR